MKEIVEKQIHVKFDFSIIRSFDLVRVEDGTEVEAAVTNVTNINVHH